MPFCLAALALDITLWGGYTELRWGGHVPVWLVVGAGAALFATIAALPDARRLTFGLAFVYSVAWTVTLPHYQPFTALLLVLYDIARSTPTRAALPYLAAIAVPWSLHTANSAVLTGMSGPAVLVTAALWAVMTTLAWMAGRFGYRAEENARLRGEAVATQAQLARQEDRLALSRELHDVLSHSMGAISLQAAGARALAQAGETPLDPRVERALEMIATTSTDAMRELRSLLGFLRDSSAAHTPHSPEHPEQVSFTEARLSQIDSLVERTRACGITVRTQVVGTPFAILDEQEHAAYRVVQEGLANVLRHGGSGSRADLTFTWSEAGLTIDLISRSGSGRDPAVADHGTGLGLRGLSARVASLGGELEAGPAGDTFAVRARLPN